MNPNIIFAIFAALAALYALTGCEPTPTATLGVPTIAPAPTLSREQSAIQAARSGTPLAEWQGIPVMPGLIKANLAGNSYSYLIAKSLDDVEKFYTERLTSLGWKLADRDAEDTSAFGGPSVALDFFKGTQTVNIVILVSVRDRATVVVINPVK